VSITLIIRFFLFLFAGLLVGELFYDNQFLGLILSCAFFWCILSMIKEPSKIALLGAPIFLYCYGFINISNGVRIESTLMVLVSASAFMLPLAWMCFQAFPSLEQISSSSTKKPESNQENISTVHKFGIVVAMGVSLMAFLMADIRGAIFCLSVVINAALRSSVKQGKVVVRSIIPVQVTGCLIALLFNMLLLGHTNNLGLFFVLLFFTTTTVLYYSYNKELRHRDIPNFEMSFLNAILIPLTLYTSPSGYNIEPFVRRMVDMGVIWGILSVLIIIISLGKRHRACHKKER
jgi:hypothetical protein